jgi:hypothetical protein
MPECPPSGLLMRISLDFNNTQDRKVSSTTSFLAPSFEVERAKSLGMPFEKDMAIVCGNSY